MKRETWKQIIQLIITVLTLISSAFFAYSCARQ